MRASNMSAMATLTKRRRWAGCSVSSSTYRRCNRGELCLDIWLESRWCWWRLSPSADRIRDLTSVQGVRENSLIGYGLVVGLDGTGDQTTQTPFTTQTLNNMLSQMGITVPTGTNMQLKNVAAVMVTAQFPAFARRGTDYRCGGLFHG